MGGRETEDHITWAQIRPKRSPFPTRAAWKPRIYKTFDPPAEHQCSERSSTGHPLSQIRVGSTVSTLSMAARRQCRRPPPQVGFLTGQHTGQASLETVQEARHLESDFYGSAHGPGQPRDNT